MNEPTCKTCIELKAKLDLAENLNTKMREALRRAALLAHIAWDWDLGQDNQVEIDDKWVSTHDLAEEFEAIASKKEVM